MYYHQQPNHARACVDQCVILLHTVVIGPRRKVTKIYIRNRRRQEKCLHTFSTGEDKARDFLTKTNRPGQELALTQFPPGKYELVNPRKKRYEVINCSS